VLDIQANDVTKMTIGSTIDIQGNELVLDADADTSIHADTDDQIDFKTAGSDRLHLMSDGDILFNTTDDEPWNNSGTGNTGVAIKTNGRLAVTSEDTSPLFVNRVVSDGRLVDFLQDGSTEGEITVSGSTVSYNGGHLSRWARLSDNSKPTSLLKGTVMSNLDDMIVWEVDGSAKSNEQRNEVKVSDTEGDKDVAGLFVDWSLSQGYNDMNMAMTGDMVIRIAKGTTVQRGDLLMSAGDGTAKPQDDDIVRSKTIAKVTSTTVIKTYDDDSYVVPCVIMAC
jgi:hypothetical protein